jgi:hypothetical protein
MEDCDGNPTTGLKGLGFRLDLLTTSFADMAGGVDDDGGVLPH